MIGDGSPGGSAWYAWETDNLYMMTVGGGYLYLRQNFRGTVAMQLSTANDRAISNEYKTRDGGTWLGDVCYAGNYDSGARIPTTTNAGATGGRSPVAVSGSRLYLVESFALTSVEKN